MDPMSQKLYIHESEALSPIKSPPSSILHSSHTSFPIIAVAIIGILATAFLLVSYYIFVIKCCLNWHRIDILRRFSFSRRRPAEDTLMVYSPAEAVNRGLNEAAIRSIPIFKFNKKLLGNYEKDACECAVCLNEFLEEEKLRVIPNCGHVFHIDCIDVWLQNNANCPLCRTSISANRCDAQLFPLALDQLMFPSPSPHQDPTPDNFRDEEDYVVIEIGSEQGNHISNPPSFSRIPENSSSPKISRKKAKKLGHVSSMGDECIDNRQKDEQFLVQPMRRSFSMDSAADTQLYLAVQQIIQRHNRQVNNEVTPNEGCSRSVKKSFFSFGQGKGSSRSAVHALEP